MRILNKLAKAVGYAGVYLLALFQSYVLSLLCTPVALCIALSIMGATGKFPALATEHFALLYILGAVPLALVFFVLIVTDYFLKFSMSTFRKEVYGRLSREKGQEK